MTSPIPLRERLAEYEIHDVLFQERLVATKTALTVFRDWLREAIEGLHAAENDADIAGLFVDQRTVLAGLADAIDKELNQ